jgi:hypothetical protein
VVEGRFTDVREESEVGLEGYHGSRSECDGGRGRVKWPGTQCAGESRKEKAERKRVKTNLGDRIMLCRKVFQFDVTSTHSQRREWVGKDECRLPYCDA